MRNQQCCKYCSRSSCLNFAALLISTTLSTMKLNTSCQCFKLKAPHEREDILSFWTTGTLLMWNIRAGSADLKREFFYAGRKKQFFIFQFISWSSHQKKLRLTSPMALDRIWTIFSWGVATTLWLLISMMRWPTRTPPLSAMPPLIRLQICTHIQHHH